MKNEDKILQLLESVVVDVAEIKGSVASLDNRLSKVEMKLEHDVANKIQILFEGQQIIQKTLDDHTESLQHIEDKVATHTVQIQVLDSAKANKRTKHSS